MRAWVSSRHTRTLPGFPSRSTIATLHPVSSRRSSTENLFTDPGVAGAGAATTGSPAAVRPLEPLGVNPQAADHRLDVEHELGLQIRDLLQGVLEGPAGRLRITERVDQHHRVVRLQRLPVQRTAAAVRDNLLGEELASAASARPLDLHAVSFSVLDMSSTRRSASSNGSTGLTNHASAPDQRASHASCRRSSNNTIGPREGSDAPRRSLASAKPPPRA